MEKFRYLYFDDGKKEYWAIQYFGLEVGRIFLEGGNHLIPGPPGSNLRKLIFEEETYSWALKPRVGGRPGQNKAIPAYARIKKTERKGFPTLEEAKSDMENYLDSLFC